MEDKKYPQRSMRQNRSGHKFWTEIADTLNEAGLDQAVVVSRITYEVPNTMESIKNIFKTFAKAMFGVNSTTELTTKQFSEVAEVMTRELSEKLMIELPDYPSIEAMMNEQRGWRKAPLSEKQ